jgi:hypothetical protein
MIFTPTGTLDYPAAADDYAFTVTSEARWQLSSSESYLTLGETTEQAATAGEAFKFTLESNVDSYAPRVAPVEVTSSDPDFYPDPRTFYIRQAGTKPFIDITDPANLTLDFGTATAAIPVAYETNARWKFTAGTGYADVIESADATAGTTCNTSAEPTVKSTGTVSFTPSTVGTVGKGGATASGSVIFTTAHGASGINEITKTVTLSRTIPAYFSPQTYSHSSGTVIPATATIVTLTVNTNMSWWLQQASDNAATVMVTGYETGSELSVTVPARAKDVAASWTGTTTVAIKAGYDAQGGLAAATPVSYDLTQSAYTYSVSTSAISGNKVTITVTTNAGTVPIRLNVTNASGKEVIAKTTVTSGVGETFTLDRVTEERVIAIVNDLSLETFTFKQPASSNNVYYYALWECPDGWYETTNAIKWMEMYDASGNVMADGNYTAGLNPAGSPRQLTITGGKLEWWGANPKNPAGPGVMCIKY